MRENYNSTTNYDWEMPDTSITLSVSNGDLLTIFENIDALLYDTILVEKVPDVTPNGYRLIIADPQYYSDIGDKAIDFSYANEGTTNGASADYSVTIGYNTKTSTMAGFALGKYNVDEVDALLEVGMGLTNATRKNALTVYNNGIISAPEATLALIDAAGEQTLVTKGWHIENANTTVVVEGWASGAIPEDGDLYALDSTVSNIVLPVAPSNGYTISILDIAGDVQSKEVTLQRNGKLIMGLGQDLIVDVNDASFKLIYIESKGDWRII